MLTSIKNSRSISSQLIDTSHIVRIELHPAVLPEGQENAVARLTLTTGCKVFLDGYEWTDLLRNLSYSGQCVTP